MLYWQWWTSYWKEWADLTLEGDITEELPPLSDTDNVSPPIAENIPQDEKYQYLTQYGTQILCLINAQTGCTYLSSNFAAITDLTIDHCLGDDFYGIIHPDFCDRFKEALAHVAEEGKSRQFRCKLQHADQKWYWYLFQIHAKPETQEYICIIENIHDSMLTQNTLQKAKLEAELALRARSEFLANMSHELRTPLNAVIGFSQIIESEMFGKIENPQYLEYVKYIQESGYDLLAKIEDLLEIANIDAGRVVLTQEEVHAGDILRHVLEAQKHHAVSAKVALQAEPPENDMLLYVDRLKLQHILGHLVINAIRFSREGDIVTLKAQKIENGQLQITVSDTGSGMSDSKLDAIVTALQEDHCWTAETNRSIGLGLALTREFVALHGGQVYVLSKANEGTTVQILLPKDCIRAISIKTPDYLRQVVN